MPTARKQQRGGFAIRAAITGCISVAVAGCIGFGIASAASEPSAGETFGLNAHATQTTSADKVQFASYADSAGTVSSSLSSRTSHDISAGLAVIEEEERIRAEEEAAAERAAIEEAAAAQSAAASTLVSEGAIDNGDGSYTVDGVTISVGSVDWTVGKDAFIEEWTARIDAYLAGSPLSGYGEVFATAAWENGVDPRWSPAISNTESSKGSVCFKSYNAWGWGSSSWSSWEEAINAHVAGLAAGYGSTITPSAAAKYCPPTATSWFVKTATQMSLI